MTQVPGHVSGSSELSGVMRTSTSLHVTELTSLPHLYTQVSKVLLMDLQLLVLRLTYRVQSNGWTVNCGFEHTAPKTERPSVKCQWKFHVCVYIVCNFLLFVVLKLVNFIPQSHASSGEHEHVPSVHASYPIPRYYNSRSISLHLHCLVMYNYTKS